MILFKWLHHILQPHCQECSLERECKTCDTLRSILEQERFEKKQLLNQILELTKPIVENVVVGPIEGNQIIKPLHTPWRIRQQELEANDRAEARIRKQREEAIKVEKLEEKVGIKEEVNQNAS